MSTPAGGTAWRRAGSAVHGEADLIASLGRGPVLDAGCGTGRVAIELDRRGFDVVGVDLDEDMLAVARRQAPELAWRHGDLATVQLGRRFPIVAIAGNTMIFVRPEDRALVIVATSPPTCSPAGCWWPASPWSRVASASTSTTSCAAACGLELVERWATLDRGRRTLPAATRCRSTVRW